jgi:hypothetical protein
VLERFLAHHESESAPATFQFYRNALDSFAHYLNHIRPNLKVSDLKPGHLEDWIAQRRQTSKKATPKGTVDTGKPTSKTYRRNLLRAIKSAF